MNKVVAVDPGKTTGIAAWNGVMMHSWEVPGGVLSGVRAVRHLLDENTVLVYEKFEILASTVRTDLTDAYTTLYINGGLLVAAADAGCRVREHRPKDKAFGSDRTLRAVGWYTREGDGHANDAARHLLKFLTDTRTLPTELFDKIIDMELGL